MKRKKQRGVTEAQRMAGFDRNTLYVRAPVSGPVWKSDWRLEFERRSAEDAQGSRQKSRTMLAMQVNA